jgi:hypothetical protein
MKDEHILDILDEKAFGELNADELSVIKAHAARCADCFQAFQTARVSAFLLKAQVGEVFEPSPFFQTRVMANLREKQAKMNPFAAIGKLWRASASLLAMLITVVVALVALTGFTPEYNTVAGAPVSSLENESTDMVILNGRLPGREPNDEQVFQIIYGSAENNQRK